MRVFSLKETKPFGNNNEDAFRICFLELFGGIDLGADPRHAQVSLRDLSHMEIGAPR